MTLSEEKHPSLWNLLKAVSREKDVTIASLRGGRSPESVETRNIAYYFASRKLQMSEALLGTMIAEEGVHANTVAQGIRNIETRAFEDDHFRRLLEHIDNAIGTPEMPVENMPGQEQTFPHFKVPYIMGPYLAQERTRNNNNSRVRFKAWDKEKGRMVELTMVSDDFVVTSNAEKLQTNTVILLQWIGFNDRYKYGIYQGSILQLPHLPAQRWEVIWNDYACCFMLRNANGMDHMMINRVLAGESLITGTVYEDINQLQNPQ